MTGTVSKHNPNGISRKQIRKVFALQRAERDNADPWSNGSIAHASGSMGEYNPRMLMMRSSSSSTARATTPPPESFGALSCTFTLPTTSSFKFLTSKAVDNGKLMTNYINSINPTNIPTSHRRDWVYYVSYSKTYEE
jgi:hypothetical protein